MKTDASLSPGSTASATLRQTLVMHYAMLVSKLARRLGSTERADDALHDAWLRLDHEPDSGSIRDPFAYVLRVASNLAADTQSRERRRARLLGGGSVAELPAEVRDDAPGPERIAFARAELDRLKQAILALPDRRRAIVIAAWVEQTPYRDLAEHYGVTVRTIQIEVSKGLAQCAAEIGRK